MTNKKRRDVWIDFGSGEIYEDSELEYVNDMEGLECYRTAYPTDPDPEWVDELIRLCEHEAEVYSSFCPHWIKQHLAKRGEK